MFIAEAWKFEGHRNCCACNGTGEPAKRTPRGASQDLGPSRCQMCGGTGVEKRAFTIAALKNHLDGLKDETST